MAVQLHPERGAVATPIRPATVEPLLDMVMPALNEELRIGATVAAICAQAATQPWTTRLIVVDNGSFDTTAEVVDLARQASIPVEVIGCRTRGKGAAVRAGILYSTALFVGFCDADLSTPPASMVPGVDLLRLGWDVVIGSRRAVGAAYVGGQPPMRRLGSMAFRAMSSRLTGRISDTQCGFKLFRRDAARALFETSILNGFAFDVEILARARRAHLNMIELPVQWTDQEGSTFRTLTDGLNAFRELRDVQHALNNEHDRRFP
jgi:glycosyltransferase involved in cell wall biosynthesis